MIRLLALLVTLLAGCERYRPCIRQEYVLTDVCVIFGYKASCQRYQKQHTLRCVEWGEP